jgi:hypothetical protein
LSDRATRRVACVDDELLPEADGRLGRVTWSIDHEVVVTFPAVPAGPRRVTVHDIGLLHPLQRTLRNRRVVVRPGDFAHGAPAGESASSTILSTAGTMGP